MSFKMPIRGQPYVRNLEGRIQSVLVVEWLDEEVQLWRTGLVRPETPGLRIYRIVTGNPYDKTMMWLPHPDSPVLLILPDPSEGYGDYLPCIRWASTVLGLVKEGQAPFPRDDERPTRKNPWIGSFAARTLDEVKKDAAWFDRLLRDHFEGNESDMGLYVPSAWKTENVEPWLSHYPMGWDDRPILANADILFERFVPEDVGDTRPTVGKYTVSVSRPSRAWSSDRVTFYEADTLSELVDRLGDLGAHPEFAVLPADDAHRWWEENTREGQLCLPDDEQEVYRLLGEPLPFAWPPEKLQPWAEQRWPER